MMMILLSGIIVKSQNTNFKDGNYKFTTDYLTDLITNRNIEAIDYIILQSSLNKITTHGSNGMLKVYRIIHKNKIQDGNFSIQYETVMEGSSYNFNFDIYNGKYRCIVTSGGGVWIQFHITSWQYY